MLKKISFDSCLQGSAPLITVEALHQLHILIFFLAVFHVLYSAITMMLGRLKVWEHYTNFILFIESYTSCILPSNLFLVPWLDQGTFMVSTVLNEIDAWLGLMRLLKFQHHWI